MNDSFNRLWDSSQRIKVEGAVDDSMQTFPRRLRRLKNLRELTLKEHLPKIKARFSERRKIQKAIHNVLKFSLAGTEHLLDIISGEPTAVLPLVEEGVIQRLTLVDAQIDDSVNTLRSQLIRTLSSGDQRKFSLCSSRNHFSFSGSVWGRIFPIA